MDTISVRGARTHNLKNINLDLPRDRFIVITGLSGSGKSSLAFDTLYAEGQRRYVESLSAYARQFLSIMEKPDVDHIEGLSPAIAIEQKSTSHNPRSTVGTVTEIYDYLRLLYARVGIPRCPVHGTELAAQTVAQMVDQVLALPEGTRWMLLAPVVRGRKGEHQNLLDDLRTQGFVRVRIDGTVTELETVPALDKHHKHDIEVVVDRFRVRADLGQRLAESFETTLRLSNGIAKIASMDNPSEEEPVFSALFACPECGYSLSALEPRLFSFNNPTGACPTCEGLGVKTFFDPAKVVHHPERSLAAGAVVGWHAQNSWCFHFLEGLARHYPFDLDTPWKELPTPIQDVVLRGSQGEPIAFAYASERGHSTRIHPFEGVLPQLERRYRETESSAVREELARLLSTRPCPECAGARLRESARHVFVADRSLSMLTALPIGDALAFFHDLHLPGQRGTVATRILKEIEDRLQFLVNVGLDYLSLDRGADTLSGGEAQRIRLASQIGAGLVGVLYVLDEPSIGLHQRDNARLLETLFRLRDLGNTILVVEHDEEAIRSADQVVDMGPGAGVHGGYIVAQGTPEEVAATPESLTGQYLSGQRRIPLPVRHAPPEPEHWIHLRGVTGNNLKDIDVSFPLGRLICVTGVSGSGKSTLVMDTLYRLAARTLHNASIDPAPFREVLGLDRFDTVVDINQAPIGRTPRSNPATYTGLLTPIRELYAGTHEARARGYSLGRFSFNVKGGRCEACQGDGLIRVEMHFLPDIYVLCDACQGRRYNRETLEVQYKGKNIHEVLEMTVEDARTFFDPVPVVARKLQTMLAVGLGYLKLGQSATTLSGGEAQRVKLSKELSRRDTGRTLYILDEPTTGLHFYDIEQLLGVLTRLRDHGNTIVVIEHNLEVIRTADWVIDLGPEGGHRGGELIAVGTPEQIAACQTSHTGRFLKPVLV